MARTIGIFAQRREYAGRFFNNLAFDYIRAIEESWGIAIVIPAFTVNLESYLDMCDAYIFPGGPDIDPSLYGHARNGARGVVPEYDRYLLSSMRKVFETKKPILGICKGMQMLNIAHGGTLKQDVEEQVYHFQPERGYEMIDRICAWEDSFLHEVYETREIEINSIHHQAVDSLGESLKISARSLHDDEVEAIEHTTLPHYGVQWHPEYLGNHRRLFEWFMGI